MTCQSCAALVVVVVAVTAGCARSPPSLFASRVAYEPLLQALRDSGGDPVKALRVHSLEDLAMLKPSRRYKYVVRKDGLLVTAPRPADEPKNEYVHPILGLGDPVRTAGHLHLEHRGAAAGDELIFVDQDSKSYCPTFASLVEARAALARVNVARDRVRFEDHPPACVAEPPK